MSNPNNEIYLSEASLFEIAIKSRMDKDSFKHISVNTLESKRKHLKIKLLKSKSAYYLNIVNVPKVLTQKGKLHADPFDLLIISQALTAGLPILSTDEYFPKYKGLTTIN